MRQTAVRVLGRGWAAIAAIALVLAGGGLDGTAAASGPSETPGIEPVNPAVDGRIAFVRNGKIITVLADGTMPERLTSGGSSAPSWSPDGTRIAYLQESGAGVTDLWIMAADGSAKSQVTTSGGLAPGSAGWSPDGLRLAFGGPCILPEDDPDMCEGADGTPWLDTISSIPPYGSPQTALATTFSGPVDGLMDVLDRVSWSPVSDEVVFYTRSVSSADDQYVVVFDLATEGGRIAYSIGAHGINGKIGFPAFNSDAGRLAFDADYDVMADPGPRGITTCSTSSGSCDSSFRQVRGDSQIAFAPSGTQVALVRVGGTRDRIVLADSGGSSRRGLVHGSQPSWQRLLG